MKQFLLSCIVLLAACGHSARHTHKDATAASPNDSADNTLQATAASAVPEHLDTSLVSLKSFKTLSLEDVLSQRWTFEDADRAHWNKVFWDSVTDTRQFPEMALFPDHSAVKDLRIHAQIGKWSLDKNTRQLRLVWAHAPAEAYFVRQVTVKALELGGLSEESPSTLRLSAEAIVQRNVQDDPYYPTNNQWRIKPARSESSEEIRQRIKGCVHFYSLFFLDNHRRQETDISFSGFPSCFEWYNGGMSMKRRLELDTKWIDCFYSESQASAGYDMLANELEKHELKWPAHPTSWTEQLGQVLDQLYNKL